MTLHEFCTKHELDPNTEQALALHLDLHNKGNHDGLTEAEYMLAYAEIVQQWHDRD